MQESKTIITPTSNDSSAGAILAVIFGLLIVAGVCYLLFFRSPRVVENNTTISPPPIQAPSAPNVNNTTVTPPSDNSAPEPSDSSSK